MRCLECNVDLSPEVSACPLCGTPASDEPETIPGIQTARYPKNPQRTPPRRYADVAFLCVLAVAFAVSLIVSSAGNGGFSVSTPLSILLWGLVLYTLAVRPLSLRLLSFGNYVFWNICSISLLAAHIFRSVGSVKYSLTWALSILIPMIFVVGMALLTLVSLFSKSKSALSVIQLLFLGAVMLVYSLAALISGGIRPLLPLLAFVFSLVAQVIILLNRPDDWKHEISARLHI